MPKHMEETKKWELFIQTIAGSRDIRVVIVNTQEIRFSVDNQNVLSGLNHALSDPVALRRSLNHALPRHGDSEEAALSSNVLRNMIEEQGPGILGRIISQDFLTSHGIDIAQFTQGANGISEINVGKLNKLKLKQLILNVEFLQSALSDEARIAHILINNSAAIERENAQGDSSPFASSILWLRSEEDGAHTIVFNYGLLMQAMQQDHGFGGDEFAPVIALVEENQDEASQIYSLNRDAILSNIHNAIQTDVIFREEGTDLFQPIMFHPNEVKVKSDKPILFHILIDTSGSMSDGFDKYKRNIGEIIKRVTDKTEKWKIVISAFENSINTRMFESSKPADIINMNYFIKDLTASGGTNLNGALGDSIEAIATRTDAYENAVLLLFTDGQDTQRTYTQDEIIARASLARANDSQFSMFSMGFGSSYDAAFFKLISTKCGFTHMALDNFEQIEQFYQYIDTLDNSKYIYEIISEAEKHIEQCAANDVAIGSHLISKTAKIGYGGIIHEIGVDHPGTINGLNVVDVVGDGNCLFYAIVRQLEGTQHGHLTHVELRALAATQVAGNIELYYAGSAERQAEILRDVPEMFNKGAFADHVIIQAVADALRININIHDENGRINTITREGENYSDLGVNILYHNIHYLSLEEPMPALVPAQTNEVELQSQVANEGQVVHANPWHNILPEGLTPEGLTALVAGAIAYCTIS